MEERISSGERVDVCDVGSAGEFRSYLVDIINSRFSDIIPWTQDELLGKDTGELAQIAFQDSSDKWR